MAVREYGEIKGILGITVQEDGVTQISSADTVNIVGGGTVTDVGGVATISIPQGVEWYREDVSAGSATYTFINSPATDTSFLVFTDSGTLLFRGIDYTYNSATNTITFLSLGANEKAYIWVAHALVNGGNVGDMVKAVYDPNNVQQNVYDYNYFINTPTIGNAPLIIKKNGATLNTFTANSTTPTSIDITVPTTVAELSDANDYVTDAELATELSPYALSANVPTKTSDLVNDSGFLTSAGDVDGPASSVDGNIVVFDGNTGKVIKDSGLKLLVSNSPTGDMCEVYYDNGIIYLKPATYNFIGLENGDAVLTEDGDKILTES